MLQRLRVRSPAFAARCERADIRLGTALARGKDHAAVRALAAMGEVGSWQSLLALSTGTLIWGLASGNARLASAGGHMLAAGMVASAVKTTIKRFVHRTRPNVLMDTGVYARGRFGPNVGPWQSFPSGHAALSVAVARATARAYPEMRNVAYPGAAGVVLVQALRGAHFPSDLVAGTLIGVAAEAGTHALAALAAEHARPRSSTDVERC